MYEYPGLVFQQPSAWERRIVLGAKVLREMRELSQVQTGQPLDAKLANQLSTMVGPKAASTSPIQVLKG